MHTSPNKTLLTLLILPLLLAGCQTNPPSPQVPADLPEAFSQTGQAPAPTDWWTAFNDPGLDHAVQIALRDNFSLATAWDRLAEANALARRQGADLYPHVDVDAAARRSRLEQGPTTTYYNDFAAGIAVSYELDLWGRIRSATDAAQYSAAASEQDLHAAAISLAASVAQTWVQLAEASDQLAVLAEQVETNQKVLDLVTERFRQGQVQAADVLRQRQLLESTQGLQQIAHQQHATLQHQLAVLLGRLPTAPLDDLTPASLRDLPALPDTGIPAFLLQRRPDVQAAWLDVLAQDRLLASAIAAQYPRLSLSASADTSAARVRDLFDDWLASLAANAVQPLFDADRLGAEADRNRAALSRTLNTYSQTVLLALQDVENALARETYQRAYLASLRQQLRTADGVIERTRINYLAGQLDYIRVLEALTSRQQLQRQYLNAQRQAVEFRIQLYRALAGPLPLDAPAPQTMTNALASRSTHSTPDGDPQEPSHE